MRACGRPAGRPRNAEATRLGILCSAREQFARCGYEAAGLRDIARVAGVDAALINRYFGGKEELFVAVLESTLSPEKLTQGERATFGRRFADLFVSDPTMEDGDGMEAILLLLRAAMSTDAGPLVRQTLQRRYMDPLVAWLGGANAKVRAQLICSVIVGLAVDGHIWSGALNASERDILADRIAPMLQSLADG